MARIFGICINASTPLAFIGAPQKSISSSKVGLAFGLPPSFALKLKLRNGVPLFERFFQPESQYSLPSMVHCPE
jgi:hypothetical protein